MESRRLFVTLLIALPSLVLAGCLVPVDFDQTGTLVQGVECVLFESDNGGLYVLDIQGSFEVGDRVRVVGMLDSNCATICQQGDGCVRCNFIGAAE